MAKQEKISKQERARLARIKRKQDEENAPPADDGDLKDAIEFWKKGGPLMARIDAAIENSKPA